RRRRAERVVATARTPVARARHEAALGERQFLLVNRETRRVADALERRWNERLRALAEAEEALVRWRETRGAALVPQTREHVLGLARDFPAVWNHPRTTSRDRKRML